MTLKYEKNIYSMYCTIYTYKEIPKKDLTRFPQKIWKKKKYLS